MLVKLIPLRTWKKKNIETIFIIGLSLFQKVTFKMNLQCNSTTVHFELNELLEFEYDFFSSVFKNWKETFYANF